MSTLRACACACVAGDEAVGIQKSASKRDSDARMVRRAEQSALKPHLSDWVVVMFRFGLGTFLFHATDGMAQGSRRLRIPKLEVAGIDDH